MGNLATAVLSIYIWLKKCCIGKSAGSTRAVGKKIAAIKKSPVVFQSMQKMLRQLRSRVVCVAKCATIVVLPRPTYSWKRCSSLFLSPNFNE